MTIIAGFKAFDGVVVCADTQETVAHLKRSVPKLRFEPQNGGTELAVAFCGSGDGPFIDKTIERAWQDVQTATSLDEACLEIETSIKKTHLEYGRIYQTGFLPEIELIYGVKMYGGSRLFHSRGPIVNEKECCAGGVGIYMADFLTSRMYHNYLDVAVCMILAAYVLFQAKEHVDGCGGDSHIAVLREDGTSGQVDVSHVKELTDLLSSADNDLGQLLLNCGDLKMRDRMFKQRCKDALGVLEVYRSNAKKELTSRSELAKVLFPGVPTLDDLGIPKQKAKRKKRLA